MTTAAAPKILYEAAYAGVSDYAKAKDASIFDFYRALGVARDTAVKDLPADAFVRFKEGAATEGKKAFSGFIGFINRVKEAIVLWAQTKWEAVYEGLSEKVGGFVRDIEPRAEKIFQEGAEAAMATLARRV